MDEITSFNQLFAEAKLRGLRMSSFMQLGDGRFSARWRVEGPPRWDGPVAEHQKPFTALHNAFVLADLQMPNHTLAAIKCDSPEEPHPSDAPHEDADLFG